MKCGHFIFVFFSSGSKVIEYISSIKLMSNKVEQQFTHSPYKY